LSDRLWRTFVLITLLLTQKPEAQRLIIKKTGARGIALLCGYPSEPETPSLKM
jgi:hypothetical protein